MILFVSLLAPYVLAYSSGVQIFLYRKTFENVQLFTMKAVLLFLYLFPTGVLYFVFLDLFDALLQVYVWFSFGVIGQIKTESELAQIESNVAEYFGMSRMDWFSFKKQKIMAQLFFETCPQVALQALLFFGIIKGKEFNAITDTDLLVSLSSAIFSSIMQIYRLRAESMAVQETFVHYALNCITARFGWVAYKDKIEQFNSELQKKLENLSKNAENAQNKYCGCFGSNTDDEDKLELDYNLNYELPLVTPLTGYLSEKSKFQLLQVGMQHKQSEASYGSVEYDFSAKTVNTLISTIKALDLKEVNNQIKIIFKFGQSLRLLGVRNIMSLMQACSKINIELPDIHNVDWHQAFERKHSNQHGDPRLISHAFDENNRPLLISLYLTGYNAENSYILRSFVHHFDVPLNEQDIEGNTILHHMVDASDYESINILVNALKPIQRILFDVQNDDGDNILHKMIKQIGAQKTNSKGRPTSIGSISDINTNEIHMSENDGDDYEELKALLQVINSTLKSGQKFTISAYNRSGESVMYLALERDKEKLQSKTKTKHLSLEFTNKEIINEKKQNKKKNKAKICLHYKASLSTGIYGSYSLNDISSVTEKKDTIYLEDTKTMMDDIDLIVSVGSDVKMDEPEEDDDEIQIAVSQMDKEIEHQTIINIMHFILNKNRDVIKSYDRTKMQNRIDEYSRQNLTRITSNTESKENELDVGYEFPELKDNMMHQLLLENYPEIINTKIHLDHESTTLG
eukprot:550350_1